MEDSALSSKKRKRDDQDDDQQENKKEMPYYLNKLRALQKKLDSTTQDNSIEIKGTLDNIQIVLVCNSATYEVVKANFQSSLKEQGLYTSLQTNRDQTKTTVVAVVVTVKTKKKGKKSLYTTNFYNTTSTILVNGIKDKDIFLDHYTKLINDIPEHTINALNATIQQKCKEFITSEQGMNAAEVQLPSLENGYTSNQSSSTSVAMESTSSHNHQRTSGNTCESCSNIQSLISVMMSKISELENKVKQQSTLIQKLVDQQPITDQIQHQFDQLETSINKHLTSKLECNSNSSPREKVSPNNQTASAQHWANYNHQQLNLPSTSSTNNNNRTSMRTQPPKEQKIDNSFRPIDNLVIDIKKDSMTYSNFNQDTIRRTLNKTFGPIIIEKVTRYNFNTNKPKIMIQFNHQETRNNILRKWNTDLFGGSSIRQTIDPRSLTENMGMLKGVPLDAEDSTVINDIKVLYPHATSERIFKEGKPMRMFKIKFHSHDDFLFSIKNGICLQSQSVKCQFEQMR